ncbi:MAG: RecQ family ATP-dependent DNA helicase [Bacteroidia bacterium]
MESSALQVLKQYWGHSSFRPLQEDIIQNILDGNDTLALLPTGGGKSICFQVPALVLDGLCLVISPLVALMKDQVERLQKMGITAHALYAGMHQNEIRNILGNCIQGKVKFLYVSPERLNANQFKANLQDLPITLIAVDEAHCISQWGFDFRPEYRQIAQLRPFFPKVPILALTATATKQVISDMQQQLDFKHAKVITGSFYRRNLSYVVRKTESKDNQILKVLKSVQGSGLIYVRSRKKTVEISHWLVKEGISASFYHAGLSFDERNKRQQAWIDNKIRVMVCTNAFGMGIDKPDCRFVVHIEMPDSLEAYYQEAGRAGRDGNKAYCLLLHGPSDSQQMEKRLLQNFPDEKDIRIIYDALCSYLHIPMGVNPERSFLFDIDDFCKNRQLDAYLVRASLSVLQQMEMLHMSDSFYEPSKLMMLMDPGEIYRYQVENEKYDNLLKILLRSYGGLFDKYSIISEKFISTKLKRNEAEIRLSLKKLTQQQVLDYQEQNEAVRLNFKTERIGSSYLRFDKAFYKQRKEIYFIKLQKMIEYAESDYLCRSRILLKYFEEWDSEDCGICDICLNNKRKQGFQKDEMERNIKQILQLKPLRIEELIEKIPEYPQEEISNYCRILLDKHILQLDSSEKLYWNGNTSYSA